MSRNVSQAPDRPYDYLYGNKKKKKKKKGNKQYKLLLQLFL